MVTNNGSTPKTLVAIRTVNNLASGHESYFCYGVRCYDSSVDTADQYVNVPPGATVPSSLIHYLKPLANAGTSEVHYCLIDTVTPADSTCLKFVYSATVTSINEISSNDLEIDLHPNPASDFINVSFDDKVSNGDILRVIDTQGKLVHTEELFSDQDIRINVTEWAEGIYYLGLNNSTDYEKVLIRH